VEGPAELAAVGTHAPAQGVDATKIQPPEGNQKGLVRQMERTEHVLRRVAGLSTEGACQALVHMVQTGVKFTMLADHAPGADQTDATAPKHLRTGINLAMREHGALVKLLIDKNLFTFDEYAAAVNVALAEEVAGYEESLSNTYGRPVTLG
jgi:hypothetical protein